MQFRERGAVARQGTMSDIEQTTGEDSPMLNARGFRTGNVRQTGPAPSVPKRRNWPKERQMTAENTKKCAHPNCSCMATSGKYCSVQCETMEKTPDIECTCGHPGCKGKID